MNKPFPETESVLAVLATAGVFAWRFDSVTGFLAVDEALAVALGVKSGDPRQILRKLTWTDRRHLWAGLKDALQYHKPFEYTVVVNDAADFRRYLKVSGYGSEGVVGVIVDVTSTIESQRREGQWLEKADLWFHLEKSTLALVQWDAERRIIRWSRRAEEIFGWTEAEVLGQRLEELSFIFEEDLDRVGSVIATLLDGRSDSSHCYNRNYDKFGRIRYCLWHNSVRRDAEGRITSVLSLADEVSSQVALALNQRDAGEQLRATLENLSEAFMAIDRDEQITYVNKLMVDMLELPREELIGRRITEIFPLEENELGYSECRRAVTDQVPVEYEQRHIPSNSWISVRAWPSHDQLTIYIRDITVEKNRREQLRLLESAVATANDMVLITEAEPVTGTGPKIVFVNDAFILHTGYSREEVIGQTPRFLQGRDTDRNDLDRIRAALEKWEPIRAEVVNYTKAGEPFWLEMSIVPIANEAGHFTHWVAIERDITDRKQVEGDLRRVSEQLAESATQYLALFQNGPLPMCVYDLQTLRIVAVNQAAIAHYGYTEAEFLSLSIVDMTSPEDQSRLIELAADAHLPGRRVNRLKNIKNGGERIEVEVYTDLIEFAGRPARMVLGHDITEKVIAERELARMTRAKELISRCNEATAQINDETELLQEICRLSHEIGGYNLAWIGYALDEPGKPIRPVVSAGLMQGYLGRLTVSWDETSIFGQGPAGRAIRTKFPAVIDDFDHDETFRPWVSLATEYGFRSVVGLPLTDRAKNEDRAFGVFVLYSDRSTKITPDEVKLLAELANDIAYGIQNLRSRNEQKRLESALLEVAASVSANSGSEFFRNLVASMTRVTGACAGFAAEIMSKSPNRVRTLAGFERGERLPSVDFELAGTFPSLLVDSQTVSIPSGGSDLPLSDPVVEFTPEAFAGCRLLGSDGVALGFLYLYFSEPLARPDFALSALRIFAARAAAEVERKEALRKIQEQASLLDRANESIVIQNMDGIISYWNTGSELLYGWTKVEAVGTNYERLLDDEKELRVALEYVRNTGEWAGEFHRRSKTGKSVIVGSRWTLVRDNEGEPTAILSIEADITERRRLEERVQRSHRLDSIGTLAGGIAHDLNNVLTPIILSTDLLMLGDHSQRDQKTLAAISKNAKRASEMIQQILDVARGMVVKESDLPCPTFLEGLRADVEPLLPEDMDLIFECPVDTWKIVGDESLLRQVFVNLCVNARDATTQNKPAAGEPTRQILVRAKNLVLENRTLAPEHGIQPGPYVRIDVIDEGMGMSRETQTQIFDPFYTTKPVGSGTGLGLSISLAIIKSHGGTIEVDSQPGRGSRFRVYLPART